MIGNVDFSPISITEAGVHEYTIKEKTPSDGNWQTDSREYRVRVTVTDNGKGQLVVSQVEYPDGFPDFVNVYTAPKPRPVCVALCATKRLCGACLCSGMFTFGVFDSEGEEAALGTNNARGNIVFPSICFNQAGEYSYYVCELNQSGNGWVTDNSEYPVIITVTDNGSGQLEAKVSYPYGEPFFINQYCSHEC
ncbi:MAG: hypothetical protein LBS74_07350 [Oscillospiraceae bacterium]|jgi:pilin isopeptide linkage protein|nr:hypothetical protein [Oscillospiraceae bacterium]